MDLLLKNLCLMLLTCFLTSLPCEGEAGNETGNSKYPQRIVTLGPIGTENIYLLEAQDRLIANTVFCVSPPEARNKEKIGTLIQANIEKIVSLRPDLVVATSLTRPRQVARLKSLGIRVVRFTQPASFQEICSQFLELGQLLGKEDKARRIVSEARSRVEAIRERTENLEKKKVFLQIGTRPLHAAVESSFTHDFIRLAGGINIAAGASSGIYSREKVIEQNPDVIIIAMMGSQNKAGKEEKEMWQRYRSLDAVQENKIYLVDTDLTCSPSPLDFVKALKTIAGLIHGYGKFDD